jgi:hypothetical protein
MTTLPATYLTMLTLVKPEGQLELSLARRPARATEGQRGCCQGTGDADQSL